MPNDTQPLSPGDIAKSQLALHTLRDYVLQQQPGKMLATDVIEDVPFLRPHGTNFANVIPSAAIISKDPKERKVQIANALQSMKNTKKPDHPLAQEMISSAAKFGLGSVPISLLLGTGELALGGKLKGYRNNPTIRKEVHKHLEDSIQSGMAQGFAFGSAAPFISRHAPFEKKHLYAAQQVLQDHPNLSALPTADLVALSNLNQKKEKNEVPTHIKHTIESAGVGAGTAMLGQTAKTLGAGARSLAHRGLARMAKNVDTSEMFAKHPDIQKHVNAFKENLINTPPASKEEIFKHITPKGLSKPLMIGSLGGAAIGGLASYFTHPNRKRKAKNDQSRTV